VALVRISDAGLKRRARGSLKNAGRKKSGYFLAAKARIDNRKNLLSSNISSTCSHNVVNFGPLTAEIDPVVWGTPVNFNGFRVLAALLHGTPVLGVSQTSRR